MDSIGLNQRPPALFRRVRLWEVEPTGVLELRLENMRRYGYCKIRASAHNGQVTFENEVEHGLLALP